jgi:hypothetical protein
MDEVNYVGSKINIFLFFKLRSLVGSLGPQSVYGPILA